MQKKFMFFLLTVAFCCLSFCRITSYAMTPDEYTQKTAVEYAMSLEGENIDVDNGQYDCVDIAKAYFREVGGLPIGSLLYTTGDANAYMYADSKSDPLVPYGWERRNYPDYIPQPGDVAVWKRNKGIAGDSGHVAVVVETQIIEERCQIKYIDQDSSTHQAATISNTFVDAGDPTCYIVPTFNQTVTDEMILGSEGRFIVLLIDNSDEIRFDFSKVGPILWIGKREYVVDAPANEVKEAAINFLEGITDFKNNYVAVVQYGDEATQVCGFTNDIEKLKEAVNSIQPKENSEENSGNVAAGLQCAEELLNSVINGSAVKNIVLCTTGLADYGEYDYEGYYKEDDPEVPGMWQNSDTKIRLYAYANKAYSTASGIKSSGIDIFTIGIFNPIESTLPSDGKILCNFFRQTALDLSSGEDYFYIAEERDQIPDVFSRVEDDFAGGRDNYIYVNGERDEEGNFKPLEFDTSISQLIYSTDSMTYSRELSYMLMALSYSAYNDDCLGMPIEETNIYRSMESLGFNDIHCENYYDDPDDAEYGADNVAFSVGRQILPNGKNMILVAIRGSYGSLENFSSDWKSNFNLGNAETERALHEGFSKAANEVLKYLNNYVGDIHSEDSVYVITGHSRGAGVANLVSYMLLNNGVQAKNLYNYNFACPDVARAYASDWNPSDRFGCIMNINNCSDPVAQIPGVLGNILGNCSDTVIDMLASDFELNGSSNVFTWSKLGTSWGKFGNTYWFSLDWNDPSKIGLDFNSHMQSVYLEYLSQKKGISDFKGWFDIAISVLTRTDWNGLVAGIHCPVDVTVYSEDGNMLACVQGNKVTYGNNVNLGDVIVLTQDDEKLFYIHGYDNVKVDFEGKDEGTMVYMFAETNLYDAEMNSGGVYQNVSLESGKMMTSTLTANNLAETHLFITDEEGNSNIEIFRDGTEEKKAEVVETSADPKTSLKPATEPTRTDEESDDSKQKSTGAEWVVWLLIAIAVLGVAAIIIAIIIFVRKKQTKNEKKHTIAEPEKGVRCSCGFVNHPDAKYCTKCGKKVR